MNTNTKYFEQIGLLLVGFSVYDIVKITTMIDPAHGPSGKSIQDLSVFDYAFYNIYVVQFLVLLSVSLYLLQKYTGDFEVSNHVDKMRAKMRAKMAWLAIAIIFQMGSSLQCALIAGPQSSISLILGYIFLDYSIFASRSNNGVK